MNKIYDHLVSFLGRFATSRNIFILTGIVSTVWFLLRVIPKPTRAAYPCMRAAAPVMSAFVCYVVSFGGTVLALKAFRKNIKKARYLPALLCLGAFAMSLVVWNIQSARETMAARLPFKTAEELNSYHTSATGTMGEPQGIVPGRVVWAWDDRATSLQGNTATGQLYTYNYWEENFNDQYMIERMLTAAVISVAGEDGTVGDSRNIVVAWDKIFTYFNNMRAERFGETARQGRGYRPGEKIFIKTNNTSLWNAWTSQQRADSKLVESNAYSLLALIKHLVEYVGVNPADIYAGDPHRGFHVVDAAYIRNIYPTITTTPMGTGTNASAAPANSTGQADINYSSGVGGGVNSDAIDINHRNATYIFNIPALKGHGSGGYSATAKNFFGCIMRYHHYNGGFALHPTLPDQSPGYNQYRVLMDMMASKEMGQKTVLYIADALYTGGNGWNGRNTQYNVAPFNRNGARNTSSLIVSLDQIAIESVCFDFIKSHPNNTAANMNGVDDHLHQAAVPSQRPNGGSFQYRPDGQVINYSLGVHEHADNIFSDGPDGYSAIKLVRLKSSDITNPGTAGAWQNTDALVNYPSTTDVIEVKNTAAAPNSYNDNIWNATNWRRMDFQYLRGNGYVGAYEGWKGLNINPRNYSGLYKYMYNADTKEMYVLAKIKDNNLIVAPNAGWSTTNYWELYDILEVFFAPVRTTGTGYRYDAAIADKGYAQHITLGAPTGNVYPVNHSIDVAGGAVDTYNNGGIVKSGRATQVGDYYYWELTLDISEIPQATFDNESTVKFSMAYNDIDYNNGTNGTVSRTGQYGTVFNPGNANGQNNAPFYNIANMGSVKFERATCTTPSVGGAVTGNYTVVCAGNSITLTLNGHTGNVIRWEYSINGGGAWTPITNTSATYTATNLTQNTQYRAVVKNGICAEAESTPATITVISLPLAPEVTTPVTYCQNAIATALTADGTNLLWYTVAVGGVGSATAPTPQTVTAGDTHYYVSQTVNGCESSRAQITATINPNPTILISSAPACAADLLTYEVTVSVSAGIVTSTLGTVNDLGENSWRISNVTAGTNITLTVTNGTCQATLPVTAPNCLCPTVTAPISGGNQSYCSSDAIPTISASTTQAGCVIDWYDLPADGERLATASNTFTPLSVGTYYAESRETTSGCVSSMRTAVQVIANAASVGGTVGTTTPTINSGSNVTLNLTGQTGDVVRWEYSINGGFWTLITNTSANYTAVNVTQNTQYRAVVKSGVCSEVASESAAITVVELPCTPVIGKDLIVEEITWTPQNPQPGDQVVFTATIRNIGNTPIAIDDELGLLFRIGNNNATVCGLGYNANTNTYVWSDTYKSINLPAVISACETMLLTVNGGDSGVAYWTAGAAGTWYVCAEVNDTREFAESNYDNNTLIVGVEVSAVQIPVTGVTFTQTVFNIEVNDQVNLANYVSIQPANATNKAVAYTIISGDNFINLNANGTVTGTAAGEAVIEVTTADGNFTARATINITVPTLPPCNGNIMVRTATAPVIDGTIDAVWANAPAVNIGNSINIGAVNPNLAGYSGRWRALYDDNNVYVLVEVTKPTAYPGFFVDAAGGNWWERNDFVELHFDGDNDGAYNGDQRQFIFRYNTLAVQEGSNSGGQGGGIQVNYASNGNYSWLAEISVPWANVLVNPTAGTVIGFDVTVNMVSANAAGSRQGYFATFSTQDPPSGTAATGLAFGDVTLIECETDLTVGDIAAPAAVCLGADLTLPAVPTITGTATTEGWEIYRNNAWVTFANPVTTTDTQLRYFAINANGTTYSNAVNITINVAPTVSNIAAPAAVCTGANLTLPTIPSITGADTEGWQVYRNNVWVTFANPVTTADTQLRYFATNTCETINSNVVNITVNVAPTVSNIAAPAAACTGTNLTLPTMPTVTGATTEGWEIYRNNAWVTFANPVTTSDTQLRYFATNTCGTTYSNIVNITVNAAPTVSDITIPEAVCTGADLTLPAPPAIITNADTEGWQIYHNNSWMTFSNPLVMDGTQLRYFATNDCGTTYSNVVDITVNVAPTVSNIAAPAAVCTGANLTLPTTPSITGADTEGWQVYRNNAWVTFANPVTSSDTQLRYFATNTCGTTNSNAVNITINTVPTVGNIIAPEAICTGTNLTLPTTPSITGATTEGWEIYRNNAWVTFANPVTSSDTQLRYFATNTCGTTNSNAVNITINTVPTVGNIIAPEAVCTSTNLTLPTTPSITNATTEGWQVYRNNAWVTFANPVTVSDTQLRYFATNVCGTTYSNAVNITVNAAPVAPVSINGSTTVCAGSTQSYSVAVVSGADSYEWTLPTGWTSAGSTTNSINVTAGSTGGNISVRAVNTCGGSAAVTLPVTITLNVTPSVSIVSNRGSVICTGESVTFTATPGNGGTSPAYQWQKNGLPVGQNSATYSDNTLATGDQIVCIMTSSDACVSGSSEATSDAIAMTVNTLPATPAAITGETTVCAGSSQTYSISAVNGATSYEWTLPAGWTSTGSTTNSINVTTGSTGGSISVRAINACGSVSSNALSVTIIDSPTVGNITALAPTCTGTDLTLPSVPNVTGAITQGWEIYRNNAWVAFANPVTDSDTQLRYVATNACGITAYSDIAEITVVALTPYYMQSPAAFCANSTTPVILEVDVNGTASAGISYEFVWERQESGNWQTVGNGATLSVSPVATTTYRASIIIKDAANNAICTRTATPHTMNVVDLGMGAPETYTICETDKISLEGMTISGVEGAWLDAGRNMIQSWTALPTGRYLQNQYPTENTTYYFAARNGGCEAEQRFDVTVKKMIRFSVPSEVNTSVGASEIISVIVTEPTSGTVNHNWYVDGVHRSTGSEFEFTGQTAGTGIIEVHALATATHCESRQTIPYTVNSGVDIPEKTVHDKTIIAYHNTIKVDGVVEGEVISIYNLLGVRIYSQKASQNPEYITIFMPGVYTVVIEGTNVIQKVSIVK